MLKSLKKPLVGALAVVLLATLSGCGQKTTTAPSTNAASSASSATVKTESASTKAYKAANTLIKKGQYQAALDKLEAVSAPSARVKNLISDLQNYLNARSSYNQGDYYSAKENLTTQSNSYAMQGAVRDLKGRINTANGSSEAAATSSSSSTPTNNQAASSTSTNVVTSFAQKMGFYGDSSYQIIPEGKNGNAYRFEVRQKNSDNTVGHLIGIYLYNSKTGSVTQIQ